jgi:hypothetical protein
VDEGLCDLELVKMHHMVNVSLIVLLKFGFRYQRVVIAYLCWNLDIMACISFFSERNACRNPTRPTTSMLVGSVHR